MAQSSHRQQQHQQQQQEQRMHVALAFPESLLLSVLHERSDALTNISYDNGEVGIIDIDAFVEDEEDAQGEKDGDRPPLLQTDEYATSISEEESDCVGKLFDTEEDAGAVAVGGGVLVMRPQENSTSNNESVLVAAELLAGVEEDAGIVTVGGGVGLINPQDTSTTMELYVEETAATGMVSGYKGDNANGDLCCVKEQADVPANAWDKRAQHAIPKVEERLTKKQINLQRLDKLYEGMQTLQAKMLESKSKKEQMVARARTATMHRNSQ
jgi:hypothetical protein